eukprot:6802420-Pyramimonas_sp.AAC.1
MQEAQIPIKDYENLIEWDRHADTSIIDGTAAENFTSEQIKTRIQPIIGKCEIDDGDWEVIGKSPARRYLIQFSGDANASARKERSSTARSWALTVTGSTPRSSTFTAISSGSSLGSTALARLRAESPKPRSSCSSARPRMSPSAGAAIDSKA